MEKIFVKNSTRKCEDCNSMFDSNFMPKYDGYERVLCNSCVGYNIKTVIEELIGNIDYQDNLIEILEIYFNESGKEYRLQEWIDWFNKKDM